jgi:SNF2 family DNA or RNA helicase
LSELFSLLSFVQPSLFKRVHTLREWFNQPFEGAGGEEQQQQQQQPMGKEALCIALNARHAH